MPLPAGVITRTVSITVPLDSLGNAAKAYTGSVSADRTLVWAATGEPIWPVPAKLPAPVGGVLTFDVPVVDQDGFLDADGSPITGWAYKLRVDGTWAIKRQTILRTFQVVESDVSPVDLDVLPDGATAPPVVEPSPYVVTVAGASGTVTKTQLADAVGDQLTAADTSITGPVDARVNTKINAGTDVIPNGIIEGRTLFQYGPSRGVYVTAQRLHYNRLRRRIGSGFFFNGSVAGHQAADTAALMYGALSTTRQGNGESEMSPTAGASTWANKAMQGGIFLIWPFGNDALHDGRPDRNSTTAKARAGAKNALHAIVALVRAEARIESSLAGTYSITSGSPQVTGSSSKWYRGMSVTGTGIPANTYVGEITGGGSGFKLSSSRTTQVDVNATATNAAVSLTFLPVTTGTWTAVNSNTAFSNSNMLKTNADAATTSYVIHLTESRRVHWVTHGIDDAEYAGTKAAPYGGTGGSGYSITVDGGSAITGTTSNEHRFGALDNCHGQKVVDLGVLGAGAHTIVITASGASKLLIDEGLLVESLTPPTVLIMKEVELPAAYYSILPTYGASYAKTQTYNGFIDAEVALWPNDQSVITHDITSNGYDKALHISATDGAYAHFNDAGERLAANAILARLNQLPARDGLTWP